MCRMRRAMRRLKPSGAQCTHRWNMRKAILLEALNATTFMVDANQQVLSYCFDFGAERCERCAVFPIAAKKNDAAHEWVRKASYILWRQLVASDINDQRGVGAHVEITIQ